VIVVDTNLIAYLFLEGERTGSAERALRKDGEWLAPLLWRSEFRNVLALYLRQKVITLDLALRIIEEAHLLMQGNEYESLSRPVLRLVSRSRCSAYDCEFVALAQSLSVPLITTDKQILSEFPKTAVSLELFVS
jgi:predicted nucleic acid-binding protein